MAVPNLLGKYGIETPEATPKKSGVPNLISTKYNDFKEAPTPPAPIIPPKAPGFFSDQRLGGIVKNTILGLPKAALDVLGPGKIMDFLKTPEGQEAAYNLKPSDVAKNILPTAGKVIAQPAVDVVGIVTGPKTFNIPGLGPTPNIQQQAKEAAQAGESTFETAFKSTPQAIFDVLALYGAGQKVFSPRVSPITATGQVKAPGIPETPGPKTGRLYTPTENVLPIQNEAFSKIVAENNIPVRTDFNPNNPIIFRMVDGTQGQFFQIKPSFLDTFIKSFKGDPAAVPPTELIPITKAVTQAEIKAPTVTEAPIVPIAPKPVVPETPAQKPTVEPQNPVASNPVKPPVIQPKKIQPPTGFTISDERTIPGGDGFSNWKQTVYTNNAGDEITASTGRINENGEKLPDNYTVRLSTGKYITKPSEVSPGQNQVIHFATLKEAQDAIKNQIETNPSLAEDLSNPDLPARTPAELTKMIDQLNKVGQAYGITRKTGGAKKGTAGHFAPPQKKVKEPTGKIELRNETVLSPRQYMSTLAHELGHAIDFAVNGSTKNTINTFGKDLTPEQKKQILAELKAVTNNLVGEMTASAKPGYYYQPTEMLARFLEKMFVEPGNIAELAPLATEMFEKAQLKNPIIAEFLDAVQGSIDKGQLKHHMFFRDMRQTYTKALGTRVGNIAWNHEINYRAMKERAKILVEKLIKTEFKGVKDDPELLFNAVESIKITKNGEPEFGTRDFANAKNKKEATDLEENGYERVLDEDGKEVNDLVKGETLPRYARTRYTPEQGKAFFDELSPAGKELVKNFTSQREEAKSYFNREVIKDVHKITSNVEGWVHHFWEDKYVGIGGKTLKMKQASAAKHRENVEGYVKNLKDAMIKSMTELNNVDAYNKFMEKFFPTVTKPIAEGQEPDPGWVEVFGNIYKGGVATEQAARTLVMKGGKTFVAKKARYQMPKDVYKRFEALRGVADEANTAMRIVNSVNRYWRVNILMHMGSNATNFISGGIQYSAKIVKDFYSEVLTGDVLVPKTRSNIFAMLTVLTPKGWQDAPDWIYGGDLSNSYGQFTGAEEHPGIKAVEKAVDAYADKGLKIYGLVERYWKKVIATTEHVKDIKSLNMVTKEGLRLPTKEEEDLIGQINKEVDLFALDYDNVPVQLAQYKRGVLGQSLKPFAVFPYKITKLYTTLMEDAFDGSKSWQDRLSSVLAMGTLIGMFAWAIEERRKKQKTPAVVASAPSSVSSAGKVFLATDEEGNEMFTRISKYPFLNLSEAGIQVSDGNIGAAWQVVRDMIGSVGPGGTIAAAVLGYKQDYQQYMPPQVIAGQALSTFVPASRILNDIATYYDPYQRKQETFLQAFASFYPTTDPELQEKLRGKIRTIQIPLEAGVGPAGDMPEGTRRTTTDAYVHNYKNDILMQALAGIYIKRIDPNVAEAFNVRAEKNAAANAKTKTPALNPFYSK